MKTIKLVQIEAEEFKGFKKFSERFGSMNTLRGVNGQGKTTIGEMISWVIAGVDMMGSSKFDPTPIDRETKRTAAVIHLEVDGDYMNFTRELKGGKTFYYVNGVPKKASEYTDYIYHAIGSSSLDLFMSVLSPFYFPAMHWEDQRKMIVGSVPEPSNAEIFKELGKTYADDLKKRFKKHSAADLEALHKKRKTDKEKELIAAKATVETLERIQEGEPQNVELLNEEKADLEKLISECDDELKESYVRVRESNGMRAEMHIHKSAMNALKTKAESLKSMKSCPSCKQDIAEETRKNVYDALNVEYKDSRAKYKAAEEAMNAIVVPDTSLLEHTLAKSQSRIATIEKLLEDEKRRATLENDIVESIAKADAIHDDLQESIFVLDALKEYKAIEGRLQVEKALKGFKTLKFITTETLKNGSEKPCFSIEMDGKPYIKLSQGEKAKAGMELIGVLSDRYSIEAPCFFDNAESYTGSIPEQIKQIIMAYATKKTRKFDGKLKLDVDDASWLDEPMEVY